MKVLAPAKINIYLEVVGRRPDGFHELRTIMMPLAFGDEIHLDEAHSGIILDAPGCGCPEGDNLAYRAATLFFSATGMRQGVKIKLLKNTPVGAGLGGGSSDASSVLMGMNELFSTGLTVQDLAGLAGQLGADCPFFIYGRTMLMGSRGDEPIEEVSLEDRMYLIVIPPVSISTAKIFSKLSLPLTHDRGRIKIEKIRYHCIEPERWISNDLEHVACNIYPELARIKEELISSGALEAGMSGSGSAFFGVYESEAHLCGALSRLARHEGYKYIPTTRLTGDIYGDYRGQGVSGQRQ